MLHLSEDQSVNGALSLCECGGRAAFRFARWIFRELPKYIARAKANEAQATVENACSCYRGGYCEGSREQLNGLMRELAGTEEARLNGNFVWLGDRSDLSVFWRQTAKGTPTRLSADVVESIPEPTREKVKSVLAQARLERLVSYDGRNYDLTAAGRQYIHRTDFIVDRLRRESRALGLSHAKLSQEKERRTTSRIDARLRELGLEGRFDDCDRITINKRALHVPQGDTAETLRFYLPNTKRRMTVDLPREDVIELDPETYAAFLRRDADYAVQKNGVAATDMKGAELFGHFDDRSENRRKSEAITDAVDYASKATTGEPASVSSFDTDDFFAAALARSYGDMVSTPFDTATETTEQTRFVPIDGELHRFTVTRSMEDADGEVFLHLSSTDGTEGDLLIPEALDGKFMFAQFEDGEEALRSSADELAEYERIILQNEPDEHMQKTEESGASREVLCVDDSLLTDDGGETVSVSMKSSPDEMITVPRSDVTLRINERKAYVTIGTDRIYEVRSGNVGYTVSGDGVARMLKSEGATTAPKVGEAAAQKATETATHAAATARAAQATAGAASTATSAGEAAGATASAIGAAVPPVEGVSATVKVVLQAVGAAAGAASETARLGVSLQQKL